jgi:hypothetical protein
MALVGDVLYVADTENHAVRRLDLKKRTVSTVAGTGAQAREIVGPGTMRTGVPLNSPWDLVLHEGRLYVAMAGPHQLWVIDPETGAAGPYAGSGREGRLDGDLAEASLAQPSGITTDGGKLYFADSEVSSIRSADLSPRGKVETIVGLDLFEFGDRDGVGDGVRLQHPLGVAWQKGMLYAADTYNNKIKLVDPRTRRTQTLFGTGEAGLRDGASGQAQLNEPGGLSVSADRLYIADTNNHVIRVADLKTKTVSTLKLQGIEAPSPAEAKTLAGKPEVTLAVQTVKPGRGELVVSVELPSGTKFTPGAPMSLHVVVKEGGLKFDGGETEKEIKPATFPLRVPMELSAGKARLEVSMNVYYCTAKNEGLCYFKTALVEVPIDASPDAKTAEVKVSYTVGR